MDVILPMLGALAAASSVTWAIFRLNARAVGWTSRQIGLMWLAGGVSVACAIAMTIVGTIFGLIILTRTWLGGRLAGDPGRRT